MCAISKSAFRRALTAAFLLLTLLASASRSFAEVAALCDSVASLRESDGPALQLAPALAPSLAPICNTKEMTINGESIPFTPVLHVAGTTVTEFSGGTCKATTRCQIAAEVLCPPSSHTLSVRGETYMIFGGETVILPNGSAPAPGSACFAKYCCEIQDRS